MTYHLDTSVCIELLRGRVSMNYKLSSCYISSIVLFELQNGLHHTPMHLMINQVAKIDEFTKCISVLPFDQLAAVSASKVCGELKRQGKPIGAYDTLIARQALASNAILLTNNLSEFSRVEGLKVESVQASSVKR